MLSTLAPDRAARLLVQAARNAGMLRWAEFDEDKHPRDDRGRFGPGSGGHAAKLKSPQGVYEHGTPEARSAERTAQETLAAAQQNPLAHPAIVLGLDQHGPDAMRYVAAYGEEHIAAPLPEGIPRGTMKECYKNASLMVLEHPELDYAEGFAQSARTGDITFMHAWGVAKDGTVVDPTWDKPEVGKYFGIRYDRDKYLQYLYKAKVYGVLGSTRKNAEKAIATGGAALRSLAEWNEDAHPRDDHGRFAPSGSGGAALIARPSTSYTPMFPEGRDTMERHSDGHGHYTDERRALHAAIVEKYIGTTTPVEKPQATILGGGPASGKSTVVNAEGIGKDNTVLVDVDQIRADLPEYKEMLGKNKEVSTFTHEEASHVAKLVTSEAVRTSRNVVLDGTGNSSLDKLGGKAASMRAGGHEVVGRYVTVDTDVAVQRAYDRGVKTGRFVPETVIRATHAAVSRTFPEAVKQGLFDRASLHDTNDNKSVLVATAIGRELTIHNQAAWDRFVAKGLR